MSDFRILFTEPLLLLLLIPAIGLTLLPYFRLAKRYRNTRNRIISMVLHSVVMLLAVSLLAGLSFSYTVPNRENELIVLVDCSYSGREVEKQREDFLQAIVDECGESVKLGIVKFGFDQVYAAELSDDPYEAYAQYLLAEDPDVSATDVASALLYAGDLLEHPETGKIVILSDGVETDRSAQSVIRSVSAKGVRVDTVYFPTPENDELQIVGVALPEEGVTVGNSATITVSTESNIGGNSQYFDVTMVDTYESGSQQTSSRVIVTEGEGTFTLSHTFTLPGLHVLTFSVACDGDTLVENNTYCSYVYIESFENVLIIEKDAGESAELQTLLEEDYTLTVLSIENDLASIPTDLITLSQYEQVILVNIANQDMPTGFDELLNSYVYDLGGGLFTVGGNNDTDATTGGLVPHAYNRDDMYNTLYQQMLPVQVVNYTPPVAVMIIIDRSGSMSGEKLENAKAGAIACLDALSTGDYCGIMSLETTYTEEVEVLPVSQRDIIRSAINNISLGGGTVFSGAIERAGIALGSVDVANKHIILVTDGMPGDSYETYSSFISLNRANGITMSIVGIGLSGNAAATMQQAATLGGGVFVAPENVDDIPQDMYDILTSEAISEIAYGEPFQPTIGDHTDVVAGISAADIPMLTGYYGTRLKTGASVPLVGEYGVPIYAQWTYGSGQVGSFMCDLNGTWSAEFLASPTGTRILYNIIGGLFPKQSIQQSEIQVVLNEDNYTSQLNVYTEREETDTIEVRVTPLSEEAIDFYRSGGIEVIESAGQTRFSFVITCQGLYRIEVVRKDAQGNVTAQLSLYKTFSYSEEYDAFPDVDPEAYLASLAEGGNGQVVTDAYEIFQTFVRVLERDYDPRTLFLILIIVLLLLDIAVRKFKFKWIHEIVRERRERKALMQPKN